MIKQTTKNIMLLCGGFLFGSFFVIYDAPISRMVIIVLLFLSIGWTTKNSPP